MLHGGRRFSLFVLLVALCGLVAVSATPVAADVIQQHNDDGSTGWYPDQPSLSSVVVPNGTFGQLFKANIDGQMYAQPMVFDGKVFAVTENNKAYAFDKVTGAPVWSRLDLGNAWHAADLGCADMTPNVGITGTPVIDSAAHTIYFTAKSYLTGNSGVAVYKMHALDTDDGTERANFPVTLAGNAQNSPNYAFNATTQLQRPGLTLMDGVVYAGFGGHCDRPPYNGWVMGVNGATGELRTRWVSQPSGNWGGGIWQAGGKLLTDKPGELLLATGNGHLQLTGPTLGSEPPGDLSETVARLQVQPDGSLKTVDFFTPYDAPNLDLRDADFGSGGPVALPESYNGTPLFGTTSHPHLMLQEGKAGYVYLLDRDDLGGYRTGMSAGDASVARLGPFGGVWSTAAVWPGDGGYVYIVHGAAGPAPKTGYFRAYKYGVDGSGNPTFAPAAKSVDGFGFGSGTPVVTSDGLNSGTALVWTIWQADGAGTNAQLRAYDAVPVNGQMHLRWSAPIGTATKFAPPAVSDNRVYVGTRDGHLIGFGSPVDQPFTASPTTLNFGSVKLNQTKTMSLTLTARRAIDVSAPTVTSPSSGATYTKGTTTPSAFPAHLESGDTLTIPVTYKPTVKGVSSGTITVPVSGEQPYLISTQGVGQVAGGDLTSFPDQVSMGGAAINGGPITQAITFTNIGGSALHIISRSVPGAGTYMTVTGLPPDGSVLNSGQSVIANVTFAPQAAGQFAANVIVRTDAPAPGTAIINVPITAAAAPPAHLVVTPNESYFGAVRLHSTQTRYVTLKNTGGTPLTITKSKPPALNRGFFVAPLGGIDEGNTIGPGRTVTLGISFTPFMEHATRDYWTINADDDSGLHTLRFDGSGSEHKVGYWMADTVGRVYQFGDPAAGTLSTPPATGQRLVAITPTPSKLGYLTLDARGKVQKAGDGLFFGSLPSNALRPFEAAVSLSLTASGRGYWIFTNFGRVFRFGDAVSFGDLATTKLTKPIVSSISTPNSAGYYMVAGDGGVFAFGDAKFYGSTGGKKLKAPVVGIVPTPTNRGYWLVASDGGIFAFGDAPFLGSMGAKKLAKPIVGMIGQSNGYLMVASDGGIFNFSNQAFAGSLGGKKIPSPIAAVASFTI